MNGNEERKGVGLFNPPIRKKQTKKTAAGMTKEQLQKELDEKIKPGVKPSDLRKLKRSKSADEIANHNPPIPLLQEQLKNKQSEVESLREQLETKNSNLAETSAELEQSLLTRHQGLKDWFKQYSQNKELDRELTENIDQASEELISQDQRIVNLQSEVRKLTREKQSLARDYQLVSRLAESRKVPLPDNSPNLDYLKYAFYSLLTVVFTLWLLNSKPTQ